MVKKAEKAVSLGQRAKARAQRAARAARELEQGVAIRAGGKKAQGVKRLPETSTRNLGKGFGLEQTGKGTGSRMATRGQRAAVARSGRKRIAAGAGGVGAMSLFGGDKEKKKDTPAEKPTTAAKKKYNVGVSKGGVPFKESFRHHRNKGAKTFTWNGKKYTTELDTEKAKRTAAAKKPAAKKKVGGIRKFLLGDDGKFGGARGAIDFLPGKSRPKRKEKVAGSPASGPNRRPKPAGKAMGGMMKPKGMRRGGRVMAEPEMPTPPRRRRRGTPRPPLNPKVLRPPLNPNLTPAPGRRTKTPTSTPTLDVLAPRRGKRPTKTPTPNVDGATRRRGKTPNRPPMPKLPGGMKGGGMASKMSAKGGARGGKKMMMPGGMKAGGSASKFPDMTGDGRVTQKDILKARGVPGFSKGDLVVNMVRELSKLGRTAFKKEYGTAALNKAIKDTNKASGLTPTKTKKTPTQKKLAEADRRAEETKYTRQTPAAKKQRQVRASEKRMERMKNGGMAKKGYAKGGMAKKGYSKGGAVSRKPRGVGVAMRGYGKALK